jgi:tetratricopeptide (TPR) repeat protein
MAYRSLASCYFNLQEQSRAAELITKAYQLRNRTSEREKLGIEARYQLYFAGNLEDGRKADELLAQTYPRDPSPRLSLGVVYTAMGDYERALAATRDAAALNPTSGLAYANLALCYIYLDHLDEARAVLDKARALHLETPKNHVYLFAMAFRQHDEEGMRRESSILRGVPGYEDLIVFQESAVAAYNGHFTKARTLARQAADLALRNSENEAAAIYLAVFAMREANVGFKDDAVRQANHALALSTSRNPVSFAAFALAGAGEPTRIARLVRDLLDRFPDDSLVSVEYVPMIRSVLALRSNKPRDAIEILAGAVGYEAGENVSYWPAYLRGEAYRAANAGPAAVREFQKIIDHPGSVSYEITAAIAHLGMARALSLSGDVARAKTAYQDFFAIWKDADPDIPVLNEAKSEYARLP